MANNPLLESLGIKPKISKSTLSVQGVQSSPDQVPNSSGAYVYEVSAIDRLRRFLILGSTATFYASASDLTRDNKAALKSLIEENGPEAVAEIVKVSDSGEAPKNDYALYALSLCMCVGIDLEKQYIALGTARNKPDGITGQPFLSPRGYQELSQQMEQLLPALEKARATRNAAFKAISKVARIGTHRLQLLEYVSAQRGHGDGFCKAMAKSLLDRSGDALAYDMLKYRQRGSFCQRDLIQITHPKASNPNHNAVMEYVDQYDKIDAKDTIIPAEAPNILMAYHAVRLISGKPSITDVDRQKVVQYIQKYNMPLEMIPSEMHSKEIYQAILSENTPITWLMRNLGNLGKQGILVESNTTAINMVCNLLENMEVLRRGRVHPLGVLVTLNTYKSGKSVKGDGTWPVVPQVVKSLEKAFYDAFQTIVPANVRIMLALDVSASMTMGEVSGMTGISPRVGASAMAMATVRTERFAHTVAFSQNIIDFPLDETMTLERVKERMNGMPFSSTDCAVAFNYALQKKMEVDCFVILTDSETNSYGSLKPHVALKEYRKKSGVQDAKCVVVGMTSNGFTIADPTDKGMLDVVGFSTAAPAVISNFAAGRI